MPRHVEVGQRRPAQDSRNSTIRVPLYLTGPATAVQALRPGEIVATVGGRPRRITAIEKDDTPLAVVLVVDGSHKTIWETYENAETWGDPWLRLTRSVDNSLLSKLTARDRTRPTANLAYLARFTGGLLQQAPNADRPYRSRFLMESDDSYRRARTHVSVPYWNDPRDGFAAIAQCLGSRVTLSVDADGLTSATHPLEVSLVATAKVVAVAPGRIVVP